ncbi:trafficking protein particle complex subunit 11 isoform X1 [Chironomus tepperi]|uniref:trafficking protein particle complex subunit 11 isoform X1 n=1 Tax=Chironomus tepperi TaxID=113505 RepID=UPI00391FC0ED
MAEFPSELLATAQPLIGFYGLDLNNSSHKAINDSFNRIERPPIQYKIIPNNYEFPTKKPKRQSFEWYNPKHILKKNWMLKYQHVVPSLIVVFMELEWKEPQWSEKQVQCSTMIQQLKSRLQDRATKIALVLLHKSTPVLASDDLIATERASALANACEINTKHLYVLPVNDHRLIEYTVRLESAFLELAQSFYIGILKNYRSHQTTSHHQTLKVRHQFKMGFISELRLDFPTALKHYTQAYANLENIRVVDTNCLEIKTVAGFISYKICRLMFKLNLPRDSITQFKAHIEKYKSRTGFKELLFEHHGWLSSQFNYFGEIFNEAVKNGLAAIQTQNPAIYYLKAAEHLYKRREIFLQSNPFLAASNEENLSPTTQFSLLYSDFFGVRSGNDRDQGIDQQIITLVREMEMKYNYSAVIINLLSQAMSQFKIYRCGRSRKKCAVMMADEYFKSGEYTKALTLYSLMLQDFRAEKWYSIFTAILTKTVQSATLSASVNDFVSSSIEALSPNMKISVAERQHILENLWKVFNNSAPTFQNQIAPEVVQLWKDALANNRSPITVNLDDIPKLIDCKFSFESNQVKFTDPINLSVYLRSNSLVPIKIAKISVILLSNSGSKQKIEATVGYEYEVDSSTKAAKLGDSFEAKHFTLERGKCYKFSNLIKPGQFVENSEVTVNAVELLMGTEKVSAILTFQKSLNATKYFQSYNIHSDFLEFIKIFRTCYIIPTFHLNSNVVHNQPMLLNEYYKIQLNLTNSHDEVLQNVTVKVSLPASYKNKVFLTKNSSDPTTKLSSCINFTIGNLERHSNASIEYFLTSLIEGNIELKQSLYYEIIDTTESNMLSPTEKESSPSLEVAPTTFTGSEEHLDINVERLENNLVRKRHDNMLIVPCVEEFSFDSRLYSLDRKPLTSCYENEEFLMRLSLKPRSPFNIDILDAFFIADVNITEKSNHNQSFIGNDISRGCDMENILTLIPTRTTNSWLTKEKLGANNMADASMLFSKMKLSENEFKSKAVLEVVSTKDEDDPFSIKKKDQKSMEFSNSDDEKFNINSALDVVELVNDSHHTKGFVNAKINVLQEKKVIDQDKKFGLYCIKWRKSNTNIINESKFLIEGVDVVVPLLNIYCTSPTERVFVREIFTYKILLKNPGDEILHFQASIGNSDGFMLSGHKQLTFTLFSHSTFELTFNLYSLKSNYQKLPELKLDIKSYTEEIVAIVEKDGNVVDSGTEITRKQQEVNSLLERWLPKSIFVHPANRKSA